MCLHITINPQVFNVPWACHSALHRVRLQIFFCLWEWDCEAAQAMHLTLENAIGTATSKHDEVTSPGLTLLLEITRKLDTIWETIISKFGPRLTQNCDPRQKRSKGESPTITLVFCFKAFFRLQSRNRGPKQRTAISLT